MKTFIANLLLILYVIVFSGSGVMSFVLLLCIGNPQIETWMYLCLVLLILCLAAVGPTNDYFTHNTKF